MSLQKYNCRAVKNWLPFAAVLELADRQAWGACVRTGVRVRVPLAAPNKHDSFDTNVSETIVLFFCIKNYDTEDYSSVTLTFIIWYFFEESFATQDLYAYGSLD